ncbi:MAG: hypothetical protein A3G87_06170 [Omnitrophica bacterium RIFCSPLOWO2_12_FULL_50_11]|nr:MAG: hypothetical protein A3G87_06170 [Omnitrophica bacterium RIFCSPLOWO2_12_FULL_50_11]
MRKIICSFLAFGLVFQAVPPISLAQSAGTISAPSIVLLEPGTRKILYSRRPHQRHSPASTTKIVTALVVLDSLPLDHWVTVSPAVEDVEPSKLYLKKGDRLRVLGLIKATLMNSANDAARALAIEVAGSEGRFAKRMTKKAHELGAKNTRFVNASGLPASGQYSTAYDLALIMEEAAKQPVLVSILKEKNAVIRTQEGKRFYLKSHNKMLWRAHDVIGKTGWTRAAKYCFLGIIRSVGREAIVSMLGSHRLWSDLGSLVDKFLRLVGAKDRFLVYGSRGRDVRRLQAALKKAGFFSVTPTGYFGTKTKEAVSQFQRAQGLRADGIVGLQTRRALAAYY